MWKTTQKLITAGLITMLIWLVFIPAHAHEDDDHPTVHAVLFYSPTCGHCDNVIQNVLPPLLDQYDDQLKIVAINTTLSDGQQLYQAATEKYEIPDNRLGVPMLIVANTVMVGADEIPALFPGIIASTLERDGSDWPEIPGLDEIVAEVQFSSESSTATQIDSHDRQVPNAAPLSMLDKFMSDPIANSIAVIVLIGMIASIIWVIIRFTRPLPDKDFLPKWIIPISSILGIGVAFYLTYVETTGVDAVCGPVGDCNTVQLSPYAVLFGILPVGLLGMIGYFLILVSWVLYHYGPQNLRWSAAIALWGMAFFGVLFSIYLTFLEPFVIGATCMWCISSAIFQTFIFLAATDPAKRAWQEDDFDDEFLFDDELSEKGNEPNATKEFSQDEANETSDV